MPLIVNGERIEDSVIQREFELLRPDYERVFKDQSPEEQKAQLLQWSKENVIEAVLLKQQGQKYDRQITEVEIEAAFKKIKEDFGGKEQLCRKFGTDDENQIRKEIKSYIEIARLTQDICKDIPEPSKEDILKFYEQNREQLKTPEQVRVAHIVKHIDWKTNEEAAHAIITKAYNELKNGAVFETLVANYSDCLEDDGDLGYIERGDMVEEFEDVVFNLSIGETSNIFRTRFGFHIAKLYDRKTPALPVLGQVRDHIVSKLKAQMQNKAIDEFVDSLKAEAEIKET